VIKHVGFDEISLKKRHKLYVTLMTDLTDPESPKVLAVARDRDTAAAKQCPAKLTPDQRAAPVASPAAVDPSDSTWSFTAATCRRCRALARGQSPHLFLRRS
jgi:hypothetical protein